MKSGDSIDRQTAIDIVVFECGEWAGLAKEISEQLSQLPSAQPEITEEQAIEHLQSTGWMQNHDREMYESGLRERLADDSDSYDALLPSAQPEIIACGDCKHWIWHDRRCGYWNHGVKPLEWCCHAERRSDEGD